MVQVIGLARLYGWMVYHTHDSRRSEPGFPDLVLCHPKHRRLVFAELKAAGGRPTGPQRDWLAALAAAGAEAALWTPACWDLIEAVLTEAQRC